MNCETFERDVLLAESGELSTRAHRSLDEHLAACERCRLYRAQLRAATVAFRGAGPAADVSDAVVARVLSAAPRPAPVLRLAWRPALAAAAALVLVGGAWLALRPAPRSSRAGEFSAILAVASDYDASAKHAAGLGTQDKAVAAHGNGLQALARELLALEGLSAEGADAEAPAFEVSPDAEPVPTDLQSRSRHASLLQRYG
jgi:hypothetical protein